MLEKSIFKEMPYILPKGPLHNSFELRGDPHLCHFWSEDKQCISWLNKHPANSIIYVAFGSISIFNNNQIQDLALGLELIGRPFLWVVRPDMTIKCINCTYPSGFKERVADRGRIVGTPMKREVIQLNPEMTPLDTSILPWCHFHDAYTEKIVFNYFIDNNRATSDVEKIICNSFEMLEKPDHFIIALNQEEILIYVTSGLRINNAFLGSTNILQIRITIFNNKQFQELKLGLELIGRPFLWVVRPDITNKSINCTYPSGFKERVANRGRMVGWSPQQKVLKHPAIACFISHCRWNSTIEAMRNGVPFLCWPYFGDQLFNQRYITNIWKVEVGSKAQDLLEDRDILARSQALKNFSDTSVMKGGSSFKNLNNIFVTIPDGLKLEEDDHNFGRLTTSLTTVMPNFLEELMRNNAVEFTYFIADIFMAWAFNIAKKIGLRTAAFCPTAAGLLATIFSIPKLIQDKVFHENGTPMKKEVIQLNPEMTPLDISILPWCHFHDAYTENIVFNYFIENNRATSDAEMIICYSFEMLEKPVFKEMPYILPKGPLHNSFELRGDPNLCHF
ncbi:hypothetical protein M5K25_011295 [Dendrobium thyrsiflorum]|uniref:UDP-glycosyltransferase n=1 Tax=Dendrobium thyrsiflorum TaxID=117978 RepID=A0ABD0V9B3_DENTH